MGVVSTPTFRATPLYEPLPGTSDQSGLAFIRAVFSEAFGGRLGDLAEQAWRDYLAGKPIDQILFEIRQTPQYANEFPGMPQLIKAGRPITEASYIGLERAIYQTARTYGLQDYVGNGKLIDLGKLIGGEVSPAELNQRLADRQAAELESRNPEFDMELRRQVPEITDGDLLAHFIDPNLSLPLIEQRLRAAQIGTRALTTGYGQLDVNQERDLAAQGVTDAQAIQGFGQLAADRELYNPLPGEQADQIAQSEQLAAQFSNDQAARLRIERRRQQREAQFGGGGSFAGSGGGLVGLAPAT
jgi:hypothetical protein